MPELPHVEGFKRYVDASVVGHDVRKVHVEDERVLDGLEPQNLGQHVTGHRLAASHRHGKVLGLALDGSERSAPHLLLHFGMTGSLHAHACGEPHPDHTRLTLELDDDRTLAVTCPRMFCRVGYTPNFEEWIREHELGPDALEQMDEERFLQILHDRRGVLKSTLMNQSLVSGIGNEYADEILFQAGLHPATPVTALDADERSRLWSITYDILSTAAEVGGALDRLPDNWLQHHRGESAHCPACGGAIARGRVSGRSTYFCPSCQPRRG